MAMRYIVAMVRCDLAAEPLKMASRSEAQFSELLVKLFEKAAWKVVREMPRRDGRTDLLVDTRKQRYLAKRPCKSPA